MPALKRFKDDEVVIDRTTGWQFLRFFWPNTGIKPGDLTGEDIKFAQALMVEALDSSASMGYVEVFFRSFSSPTNALGSLTSAAARLIRNGFLHWYRNRRDVSLTNPKVYESVRRALARNYKSAWEVRIQTGELVY